MRGGVGIIGRTSGAEGDEVPLPSVAMTEKAVGSNVVVDRGIIMPLGGLVLVSCSRGRRRGKGLLKDSEMVVDFNLFNVGVI